MKRSKGLFAPACVAVALVLLVAPWAQAQVMQQVPADALVVIKFNKLKPTSDKIAAMAQKLGIAAFRPELADPLGALKAQGNMQKGLDENGEAAMVIANTSMQGREPPFLLFLPVTDYKTFMSNFADAKATGDVSTFKFGGDNSPSYAVNWGKYAVISPRQELVAKKPSMVGITATGLSAKELVDKDVIAYVNMKSARAQIMPEIAKARTEFLRDFERNFTRGMGGQQPPRRARPGAPAPAPAPAQPGADPATTKYLPVMKALFSRLFDVAEGVVRDSDAATWGISFTADGIRSTALAEFAPSSTSAAKTAAFKGSDKSLLTGLPQTKYLLFGGVAGDAQAGGKLIAEFLAPIEVEVAKLGADAKPLQAYIDSIKRYVAASKDGASGFIQPKGALGQEAIIQMVSVGTGDAKALIAAQKDMFSSQQAFMDMFSPPQMRGQMKSTFTPNAKTIDGVQLNLMQSQFTTPPAGQQQSPQMMQMKQMMAWMYGPGGVTAYVGELAPDKVIGAVGVNDSTMTTLIAAAKANKDVLSTSPGVAAVSAQLPKTRCVAAYIALDNIASTVANYAKMFGMPVNFQLPADLPPIGITIGAEGSALRADYYVPAQLVQSVVAAGIQSYMQMQGGQQPGGPGGL